MALDIDGTIVGVDGHISPRVRRAIRDVLDRGVLVVLCTGRIFSEGVKDLGAELGLSLPAIVRNGTAVQELLTGAVLDRHHLPNGAETAALDIMLRHGLSPVIEEGPQQQDRLFAPPRERCHAAVFYFMEIWKRSQHLCHVALEEDLYRVADPNWIGGCGSREATDAAHLELQHLPGIASRAYGDWRPDGDLCIADIMPSGCSKASALARFATQHGINLSDTLAIGDFFNDIEMLKEVGWGVAMGHAPDALKDVADAVTLDISHDGAAIALERYVLGRGTLITN